MAQYSYAYAAEAVGPVVFVLWRDVVSPEAVEDVAALLHATAEDHPEGIAFITVAQFRAPIPSAAIRQRIVEVYAELGPRLHGVAQVVEGSGFWASAALCFLAGMTLLHRSPHRMKVFGTADDAAVWVGSLELPGKPKLDHLRDRIAFRVLSLAGYELPSGLGQQLA